MEDHEEVFLRRRGGNHAADQQNPPGRWRHFGFGLSQDLDCKVYLINGVTEIALIDAGAGLELDHIVANIEADGLNLNKLRYVLLTHAHADHELANNGKIVSESAC